MLPDWDERVTWALPRPTQESLQLRRRFELELDAKEAAERVVLLVGCSYIPFREMGSDQRPLSALAERFAGDRHHPGLYRLAEAADFAQPSAQRFEGSESELGVVLAPYEDPVLRPIGEEIRRQEHLVQIGFVQVLRVIQDPSCQGIALAEIHGDPRRKPKMGFIDFDEGMRGMAESPECGPEAPRGMALGRVAPQRAGNMMAAKRPFVKRKK